MAKSAGDKPTASAEELKRRKKQARREAKLMLAIEEAKKAQKKAQKRQSKAQARLEARTISVHTLEARLAELRAPGPEPESAAPPQSTEPEHQQEQFELEGSIGSSNGKQLDSPETGASTSNAEEQKSPFGEEATLQESMARTKDVTEGEAVQHKKTATASDPSPIRTTSSKAGTQKTTAARTSTAIKRSTSRSTATKRPASRSTATKRPASRSQSTRQSHSDAE